MRIKLPYISVQIQTLFLNWFLKLNPKILPKFIFHGCTRNSKAAMNPGQQHIEFFDFTLFLLHLFLASKLIYS